MATRFEQALAQLAVDSGHVSRADAERSAARAKREGLTLLDALVEDGFVDRATGERLADEVKRSLSQDAPGRAGTDEKLAAGEDEQHTNAADETLVSGEDVKPTVIAGGDREATRVGAAATSREAPKALAFPVENWDRYRFVGVLGEGGMGQVFLADDLKLGRRVALKFIRGGEGAPVERFLQEARTQANVEHDNICRIYEVGEVQGRPYIAMQYVDGSPLDAAARGLPLEQKLLLLEQVAEAVHAAHRQGLIHRDIKPSNVLVEKGTDGRLKPYLVDFGLARDQSASELTVTGAVLGTPHFMSPEQASGESGSLDRRADVYSLGATLYAVLSGRPPFPGKSFAVLLRQVIEDVPEPLTRADPSIPADVDAIVMKCMRKDPRERYASARDLALDIRRYLDGEPVEARPTGLLYRLRMRAARNRLAVSIAAVAALLVLATAAWGVHTTWSATRRERLAQELGQQVERIESFARASYMLPLHDVRPDREEIQRQMGAIQARMDELGAIARGPGQYALARGDLVLGKFAQARERLESARAAGYHGPPLDYALGRALGELYMEAHAAALRLDDASARARRLEEIDERLKGPALAALRRGRDASVDAPEYVEALIAFYDGRYDDAIASARAAWQSRPFQYEARSLEGRIHVQKAVDLGLAGDYESALAGYDLAEDALRDAVETGRSDPLVYTDLCRLYPSRMKTEIHGKAGDPTAYFEKGMEACALAQTADPDGLEALIMISGLQNRMAEYRASVGEDARALLTSAIETSRRVVEADPSEPDAHDALASSFSTLAQIEIDAGEDPRASLEGAIDAFKNGLALREEHWRFNDLGVVYKLSAQLDAREGVDPSENLGRSIDAYQRSLELHPEQVAAWNNIGQAYFNRAGFEMAQGSDPGESLDRAIDAYERGLELDPDQMVIHYNLARTYMMRADERTLAGADPTTLLERSIGSYRKAIEVNPESAYVGHFRNGLGLATYALALHRQREGMNPSADLDAAQGELEAAARANPRLVFPPANLALVELARAAQAHDRGDDPTESTERVIAAADRAIAINPSYVPARDASINALALLAAFRAEQGAPIADVVRRGRAAVEEALAIQPESVSTLGAAIGLELEAARAAAFAGGEGSSELREARKLGERLDANEPESPIAIRAAGRLALEQARRGGASEDLIARAIGRLGALIEKNVGDHEARALRGALRLEAALAAKGAEAQRRLAVGARDDLEASVSGDARLGREFRPLVEPARSLSR